MIGPSLGSRGGWMWRSVNRILRHSISLGRLVGKQYFSLFQEKMDGPKESSRQANDAGLLSLLLVELEGFAGGRTNKQRVGKRTEVAGYPTFINTFLTVHLLSRGKKAAKRQKVFLFRH
uniref:(northern house mosquito) hypothetical protein n=1 Tax=Culex pipiens TaxID=7175 RepID=A0A8D8ATS1_CULPI